MMIAMMMIGSLFHSQFSPTFCAASGMVVIVCSLLQGATYPFS